MADPTPLVQLEIKNASVSASLDADGSTAAAPAQEFGDHIDNVALTTTSTVALFKAVSGNSTQSVQPFDETLVLNLAQSLKPGSFWRFLRENHGRKGTVVFTPQGGQEEKITASVTYQAPGVLGGTVGAGMSGATLLVNGQADIS